MRNLTAKQPGGGIILMILDVFFIVNVKYMYIYIFFFERSLFQLLISFKFKIWQIP